MKYCCLLMLLIGSFTDLPGQNLVPNASFETIVEISNRWSGTFAAFNRNMQAWYSPTQGSPDILHNQVKDKMFPHRDDFDLKPHFLRTVLENAFR